MPFSVEGVSHLFPSAFPSEGKTLNLFKSGAYLRSREDTFVQIRGTYLLPGSWKVVLFLFPCRRKPDDAVR